MCARRALPPISGTRPHRASNTNTSMELQVRDDGGQSKPGHPCEGQLKTARRPLGLLVCAAYKMCKTLHTTCRHLQISALEHAASGGAVQQWVAGLRKLIAVLTPASLLVHYAIHSESLICESVRLRGGERGAGFDLLSQDLVLRVKAEPLSSSSSSSCSKFPEAKCV